MLEKPRYEVSLQGPTVYQLCDLGQESLPLGSSESSSVKWVSSQPLSYGVVTRSPGVHVCTHMCFVQCLAHGRRSISMVFITIIP